MKLGMIRYRAQRFFWFTLYYCFARHLPPSYKYQPLGRLSKMIRAFLCSRLFQRVGTNINVESGADFENGWCIELGSNSSIGINSRIPASTKIGDDVMMGPDVVILEAQHRFDDTAIPMTQQGYTDAKPVTICDDVWIGTRAIILPGVTIGKGVVVGAGAIVTKDVPAYAVYAGNPGRIIKYRNEMAEKVPL